MRYLALLPVMVLLLSQPAIATWKKINDVDYIWGPFKIYNISLFSETGEYVEKTRPLMLTLKYAKPVDGRDFAISLARSWSNLGITLKDQDDVVDRLRKILPNIKANDLLSYIALEDKGYFILNDLVITEEFNKEFNDAVVAVWLDPRVEIGQKLIQRKEKEFIVNLPSTDGSISKDMPTNVVNPETNMSVSSDENQKALISSEQNSSSKEQLELANEPVKEGETSAVIKVNQESPEADKNVPETKNNKKADKEPLEQLEDKEIEISPPLDHLKDKSFLCI